MTDPKYLQIEKDCLNQTGAVRGKSRKSSEITISFNQKSLNIQINKNQKLKIDTGVLLESTLSFSSV